MSNSDTGRGGIPAKAGRGTPSEYAGVAMRSKVETWAAMRLDHLGWSWLYEPDILYSEHGDCYIPDFEAKRPDGSLVFIEVKVQDDYDTATVGRKFEIIREIYGNRCTLELWVGEWHRDHWTTGGPMYTFTSTYHDPTTAGPPPVRVQLRTCTQCDTYVWGDDTTCRQHTERPCGRCETIITGYGSLCPPCSEVDQTITEISYLTNGLAEIEGLNRYPQWQSKVNQMLGVQTGGRHNASDEATQTVWQVLFEANQTLGVDVDNLFARNSRRSR